MVESWYLAGADGRHYCWNKQPTFICPHSRALWDVTDLETGQVTAVERQPGEAVGITFKRHVSDIVERSASELGMDPELMAQMIERGHRSSYGRRRVNGKLTDRCKVCGAKMERLGFRCWIERPLTAEEELEAGAQVTRRLGGLPTKTVKAFHVDTKREAEQWAREEQQLSKSIAAER